MAMLRPVADYDIEPSVFVEFDYPKLELQVLVIP
jgi:hypothetical protein